MNVYFEDVKFYHYPLIKYYLLRRSDIYIFDFDKTTRNIKWLRDLVDRGRILKVSPYVMGNDSLALDNIERAYDFIAQKSRLINSTVKLYGEQDIELAYKKMLAKELSKFYAVQLVLRDKEKEMTEAGKIIFIPRSYLETLRIIVRCKAFNYKLKNILIPHYMILFNFVDKYCIRLNNWIKVSLNNFRLLAAICWKILSPACKNEASIPNYKYAISVHMPSFQFRFTGNRAFDFLLDHSHIRKDNTVFLLFSGLEEAIASRLSQDNYNVIDFQKRRLFRSSGFRMRKNTKNVLAKSLFFTLQVFFRSFFEEQFIVLCSQILFNTYLQWTLILNNFRFSHYITFNDEEINHIGRNILLNKHNVRAWYYAHSGSLEGMHTTKELDISKRRHWLWSFLFYDYYIGWNSRAIEFYKLHQQKIKNYYNAGCIWSEFIGNGRTTDNLASYFARHNIKDKELKEGAKILSIFDTSFFDGVASKYPLRDGIKFYNDILKLLAEEPDLFIIVKEKKPEEIYSDKSSLLYSRDNKEYSGILKDARNNPRCYVAGHSANPSTVIKFSDLTVTYAFSSSTVEALGARKKAIFYDPMSKLRGYYYDEIPDFVAHGYEELKNLVNKLLYQTTDREYDEYLNREILNKVEDYLDGKGLTRFRNFLIST